jgi:hypothetical protein
MTDIMMVAHEVGGSGRYAAYVDGRHIVASTAPFCDAARVLLEQGYDPTRRLVMRRPDREQIDLSGQLGAAAKLTVQSNTLGTPKHCLWKGRKTGVACPPIRSNSAGLPKAA